MADKVFPEFFSETGKKSETFEQIIEKAKEQIQVLRTMMSFEIQIDFEKADLNNDQQWMEKHWLSHKKGMVYHALASYGIFMWNNFREWLKIIATIDNSAKRALELFNKHPEHGKGQQEFCVNMEIHYIVATRK